LLAKGFVMKIIMVQCKSEERYESSLMALVEGLGCCQEGER